MIDVTEREQNYSFMEFKKWSTTHRYRNYLEDRDIQIYLLRLRKDSPTHSDAEQIILGLLKDNEKRYMFYHEKGESSIEEYSGLQFPDSEKRRLLIICKTERQYCVTWKEVLVVVMVIKHFHHYLYGTKFLVRTDHGINNTGLSSINKYASLNTINLISLKSCCPIVLSGYMVPAQTVRALHITGQNNMKTVTEREDNNMFRT